MITNQVESAEDLFIEFVNTWERNLEPVYEMEMRYAATRGLPLIIDFSDLYSFSPDLGNYVIDRPIKALAELDAAVRVCCKYAEETVDSVHVRIKNLPVEEGIRGISSWHVNKLIQIHGLILRAYAPEERLMKGVFKCRRCGHQQSELQDSQFIKTPYGKCEDCERKTEWDLVYEKSTYKTVQILEVQELLEEVPPGDLPRKYEVEVEFDLVNTVNPGQQARIVGIITGRRKSKTDASRQIELFMKGNYLDILNKENGHQDLAPETVNQFHTMAEDPLIIDILTDSFAPSIYGHRDEKKAILLLLTGGVPEEKDDVITTRGDINTLLLGDPGTAKSQLLKIAAKTAARGMFTTGRGSTAAGLTAAVVKTKDRGFVLEAGALVLCDKGTCCIDEMDKMREEDRGSIHPAMEQQIVPVAKGGIVATLNARTSILAAANPTMGRYNPYQTIAQNIKEFPITILNRFDLIFVMRDVPDVKEDKAMARHILGLSKNGLPGIRHETLRQYIIYARTGKPRFPDKVKERIEEFYINMRKAIEPDDPVAVNARTLESTVRLAYAHAKLRLSDEVSINDVMEAIRLVDLSMSQVGIDPETGKRDVGVLEYGKPKSAQDRFQALLYTVKTLEESSTDHLACEDEVYSEMEKLDIPRSVIRNLIIRALKDPAYIYEPFPNKQNPGFFKMVN